MNLAARAGRWSARHRTKAIVGWLVLVVLAAVLGGMVGTSKLTDAENASGDSAKAEKVLAAAGFKDTADEQVLVQVRGAGTAHDASARAALTALTRSVEATGQVQNVRSPLTPGNAAQFSKDGRSAVLMFEMKGASDDADKRVQPVLDAVGGVQRQHADLRVEEFGDASANKALNSALGDDFHRAELLSIPLTIGILLVAFGALLAALVPVGLALTAVIGATGLLAFASKAAHVDDTANSVMLLIGLAVGVDYSLFYIRREREERAAGRSKQAALDAAAATSGRSVLISGITVLVAMAGMFLIGNGTFTGIAIATILVVAVAVVGSLTVLPALLSLLGDKIDRGRVPFLGKWLGRRRAAGTNRVWSTVLGPVMKYPAIAAAAATAILLVLALPATKLHTTVPGADDIPHKLPIMQTYDRIQAAFPGGSSPARVVVSAPNVTTPAVQAAIGDLHRQAVATGQLSEPVTVEINPARTVEVVSIPVAGTGTDAVSQRSIDVLRHQVIPATVGKVAGSHVTGETAGSMDFNNQMSSRAPIVFVFVLGLAFLLLLWTFRSLVIAAKAIVLNLLSVAASYGVLVAVFQWGWGESLLDFRSSGGIAAWLPLFLFVVLFGLSMDYHVFILSRIREAYDRGESTRDAVHHGIVSTAGVVTSAAVVMVGVFSIFGTLSVVSMKELGIGLAVAVLLDATLVRAVLLPAVMMLLGDKNWYLPKWLSFIPQAPVAEGIAPADMPTQGKHRELSGV